MHGHNLSKSNFRKVGVSSTINTSYHQTWTLMARLFHAAEYMWVVRLLVPKMVKDEEANADFIKWPLNYLLSYENEYPTTTLITQS